MGSSPQTFSRGCSSNAKSNFKRMRRFVKRNSSNNCSVLRQHPQLLPVLLLLLLLRQQLEVVVSHRALRGLLAPGCDATPATVTQRRCTKHITTILRMLRAQAAVALAVARQLRLYKASNSVTMHLCWA